MTHITKKEWARRAKELKEYKELMDQMRKPVITSDNQDEVI